MLTQKAILRTSTKLLVLGLLIFILNNRAFPQEFVVLNDTIEYNMESTHGYYFYVQDYISTLPQNWSNYKSGQFYTRYEILSQASSEQCGLQFGIWQWRINPPEGEKTYSETMAEIVTLNGPGDIAMNNSSPTTWWKSYEGVDFSRVSGFWRLGINIWSLSPRSVIAPSNWGGDNNLWAERDTWFPIRIKVMVIAVADGSTFSGWNNYLSIKPPTPNYTINYHNETTNKVVPPADEYAYNPDMSGAVQGDGTTLQLQPGQDVYFRTRSEGINPASNIQYLQVPPRPSTPDFEIDFEAETTSSTIGSTIIYSEQPEFGDYEQGTGNELAVEPGTDLYFKVLATASSFASEVQFLEIPDRPEKPAISIDYFNEETQEVITSAQEYAFSDSTAELIHGAGQKLDLSPGQDLFIRVGATSYGFASYFYHLNVENRPEIPEFTINYESESTNEVVSTSVEYSTSDDLSDPITAANDQLSLNPGNDLYFRVKATSINFISETFHLEVPDRPEAPDFTIDFTFEVTGQIIPSSVNYTFDGESDIYTGNNEILSLEPGTSLNFWHSSTASAFKSEVQELPIPDRPVFEVDIDFENEQTLQSIPEEIIISESADFSIYTQGTNTNYIIQPSTTYYFKQLATASSFASEVVELDVPARPQLASDHPAVTDNPAIPVTLSYEEGLSGFDPSGDLEITNGTAQNFRDDNTFDLIPESTDTVKIYLKPNGLDMGNFKSNELAFFYTGVPQSLNDISGEQQLHVSPNPATTSISISSTREGISEINVFDLQGKLLRYERYNSVNRTQLNVSDIKPGTYLVVVRTENTVSTELISIQ